MPSKSGLSEARKKIMYPLSIVKNKIKLVKEFSVLLTIMTSLKFSVIAGIVEAQTRKKVLKTKQRKKD